MQGAKPPSYQRMMSSQYMRDHNGVVQQDMAGNRRDRTIKLYKFKSVLFDSSLYGNNPQTGPTLAQSKLGVNIFAGMDQTWKDNTAFYNNIGNTGIQVWTVPVTGNYRFTAKGAAGASNGGGADRGAGAIIAGTYRFLIGEKIYFVVGQRTTTGSCGGGGGGGTFVAIEDNTYGNLTSWPSSAIKVSPLIIAGGGGGQNDGGGFVSQPGSMSTSGTYPNGAVASNNGNGGPAGSTNGAAGWSQGGGVAWSGLQAASFITTAIGGTSSYSAGGYGGGGPASCSVCNTNANAGPGGGYSGGASYASTGQCYEGGGGGGSFIRSGVINPATSTGTWSRTGSEPHPVYGGAVSNIGSYNVLFTGSLLIELVS